MINSTLKKVNIKFHPAHLFYAPEWLVLGVNNLCNLHCKMCDVGIQYTQSNFYQNLMGSHPLNMPLELLKKIIDEARDWSPKIKLGYAFTEPLIYPHLLESLDYAQHKGLYTSITSNALNLSSKARDLQKAGLKDLFISLDGPAEIHNQIRGHKSSFERAIKGIEAFEEGKDGPRISIFCCITEWNIGHLLAFCNFFRSLPVQHIGFMHTNFTPNVLVELHNQQYGDLYPATLSNTQEIEIDKMNLSLLADEIREIEKGSFPFSISFSPNLASFEDLYTFYQQPEKKIGRRCNDVFRNLMIKSDGQVIPAHGRCYSLEAGNLYQQSLKEIWNGPVLAEFRKNLLKAGGLLPACHRCCSAF